MIDISNLTMVFILCTTLSLLSYWSKLLTTSGAIAAFATGFVIGGLGSISWLIILIAFTLAGFLVTKYKIQSKMKKGLQEGQKGERTYKNVLANGLVPAFIALFSWLIGAQNSNIADIAFLTSISVAASDTIASELGVLSPNVWLITNFQRVEPGTDGGVSIPGTLWALVGATLASLLGWIILFPDDLVDARILIPIALGFVGCNIDSLVGATWERKGYVSKLGTNMISMAAATIIALVFLL